MVKQVQVQEAEVRQVERKALIAGELQELASPPQREG